jgi:GxxExxY protein
MMTKTKINELSYQVIGAIIEVHKILGPGLLEIVYHKCLMHELSLRCIKFHTELSIPIFYKDLELTTDFRCDLLIENCIMLELKAVQEIVPYFKAKLLSHMNLTETPKGFLINFNVKNIMKEGLFTFVNEHYSNLPD